ncbi:type I methionyl aminopeptidase [Mucilaginibacter sp. BJC16-A38]|uniref:type I methionyl aminopeptidase n=1 Tax=Mucilaginibacter phenanthrenivorans TaxID=1234842 RepID=UPI00215769FA|nr:type I methionyl aminopeptidase [Mucilaginibacter phenanthrenivorans]MCR8557983.1 type I methionyl aminopeptidase [Mucilaginibacter phenanthrenivorans]
MSITTTGDLTGMKAVSELVALVLRQMIEHAKPGMTAKELDDFGGAILNEHGANSAPIKTYNFPGYTCISINHQVAHGIPKAAVVLQSGDLVNIDVSAELNGYWSDNGCSFVLGEDVHGYQPLVNASKEILRKAISSIKGGVKVADIGQIIETEAKKRGYTVIKNLTGHGVGRSLHEEPHEIANYRDRFNMQRFKKNSVVAVETFISTASTIAETQADGWTLVGNKGGFVAQHEHTILITGGEPVILTANNGVWD